MRLITERELILQVLDDWKYQYKYEILQDKTSDKTVIYYKLKELNFKTVSAKEIEKIIGNNSWTTWICSECEQKVKRIIQFKKEDICLKCFKKLMNHKEIKDIIEKEIK